MATKSSGKLPASTPTKIDNRSKTASGMQDIKPLSDEEEDRLLEKVRKAKYVILSSPSNPYILLFSFLVIKTRYMIDPRSVQQIGGYGYSDNKGNIYFAFDFVNKASIKELMFTILHEILHSCRDEFDRFDEYVGKLPEEKMMEKNKIWNVSADTFINEWLKNGQLVTPEGIVTWQSLVEKVPELRGKQMNDFNTETLYEFLDKHTKKIPASYLTCAMGKRDTPMKDDSWKKGAAQFRRKEMENAIQFAKQQGQLPTDFNEIEYELGIAQLSWKFRMATFLSQLFPQDYSMKQFDRVMWNEFDLWLPDIVGDKHKAIIIIDTSGSICQPEYDKFMTEMNNMIKKYNCELRLLASDTEVGVEIDIKNKLPKKMPYSGGGTSFVDALERVSKMKDLNEFEFVAYFTDGWGEYGNGNPIPKTCPLVWVLTTKHNPPFGERIYFDDAKGESE
jgi:predicted metal-dependent peptidase